MSEKIILKLGTRMREIPLEKTESPLGTGTLERVHIGIDDLDVVRERDEEGFAYRVSYDGTYVATIAKGQTRLGGFGWVWTSGILDQSVSRTFKNLAEAKADIAFRLDRYGFVRKAR